MEGLFLSRLPASMLEEMERGVFGVKPFRETQRFWPARPALANPHNQGTYGLSPAPLRIPPKRKAGCG